MIKRSLFSLCALIFLAGCSSSDWWGEDEEKALPGKRVSVLTHREELASDRTSASLVVALPPAKENSQWFGSHTPWDHLALGSSLSSVSSVSLGGKADVRQLVKPSMVIGDGRVYVLTVDGNVAALQVGGGKKTLWEKEVHTARVPTEALGYNTGTSRKAFLGGEIAFSGGTVYVTTRNGDVVALNAATGEERWRQFVNVPVVSAPSISQNRLFFVTANSKIYALQTGDGAILWTHSTVAAQTSLSGSAAPLVQSNVVYVPYPSGDLYALRVEDGEPLWTAQLGVSVLRRIAQFQFSDIEATPLLRGSTLYTVNYGSGLSALNVDSGEPRWNQSAAATETPWISGEFLFLLTSDQELLAIHRADGKIKWVSEIKRIAKEREWIDDDSEHVAFSGPVLAGKKLYVAGSFGKLIAISPFDGAVEGAIDITEGVYTRPAVAGSTLYVLSNDGTLQTLR